MIINCILNKISFNKYYIFHVRYKDIFTWFTGDERGARNQLNQAYTEAENLRNVCLSQPEFPGMDCTDSIQFNLDGRQFSFSQPAHVEDLLLGTQLQAFTQASQVHSLLNETLN